MEDNLKYVPIFVDLGGDIELNTVILTREPKKKLKEGVNKAISQVKKNKEDWCVDDIIEEIGKRVNLVNAEEIQELCL